MQLQRDIGIFRRVAARFFQRDLIECELVFTFTRNLFKGNGFVLQPAIGEAIHIMAARHAVKNVGFQHGIKGNTAQFNAVVSQDTAVIFEVLPNLQNLVIFQ